MTTSAEDFSSFVVNAMRDRRSLEYKELYHFLQDCFTTADRGKTGKIGPAEFDEMIEVAADAPRRFGFAPSNEQTYQSVEHRQASRRQMFADMDVDKSGFIAFSEWLDFCNQHIFQKAQLLDPSLGTQ